MRKFLKIRKIFLFKKNISQIDNIEDVKTNQKKKNKIKKLHNLFHFKNL